ncbi:conserved exported protein of unknown function [Nitrosotalea devaniterrae]|uniref:Uncharacterized protein n=1 Tax=Nitrosotalea devaniterrae TaxID=1078905 RepID=A0A128A1G2_9ARCH|nr:conserved exported protein of unknown function [Candidatus Nitrosotalea devanaterra]
MPNIRIVAIFAVIVIAAVAGIAWPFLANMKHDFLLQPVQASQWTMGKGSEYNPEMVYQVSFNQTKFSADMKFLPASGGAQQLLVKINPSDGGNEIDQTVNIGLVYDFVNTSNESKSYFDILNQSIFSMRDYATEAKYLAKDAEWGDLYIGANQEKLKVTDSGKMSFQFGSTNAYLLSYRIGANINKIWIVDNLPLPVKAEIYDPDGNLQYTYELVSLKASSTPGFTS